MKQLKGAKRAKVGRNGKEQRRKATDQRRRDQSQMASALHGGFKPDVLEVGAEVDETNMVKDIGDVTKEIKGALRDMKNGKAPGIDSITSDLLKADTDTTVNTLHGLVNTIWKEEWAYRQSAQERGFDKLWYLERYHPLVHSSQGVGQSSD